MHVCDGKTLTYLVVLLGLGRVDSESVGGLRHGPPRSARASSQGSVMVSSQEWSWWLFASAIFSSMPGHVTMREGEGKSLAAFTIRISNISK